MSAGSVGAFGVMIVPSVTADSSPVIGLIGAGAGAGVGATNACGAVGAGSADPAPSQPVVMPESSCLSLGVGSGRAAATRSVRSLTRWEIGLSCSTFAGVRFHCCLGSSAVVGSSPSFEPAFDSVGSLLSALEDAGNFGRHSGPRVSLSSVALPRLSPTPSAMSSTAFLASAARSLKAFVASVARSRRRSWTCLTEGCPGFLALELAPVLPVVSEGLSAPELSPLPGPSVLTSLTSAETDLIVGESGPNRSMTPAPANATLASPAVAIGPTAARRPRLCAMLCFPTILPGFPMSIDVSVNKSDDADASHFQRLFP